MLPPDDPRSLLERARDLLYAEPPDEGALKRLLLHATPEVARYLQDHLRARPPSPLTHRLQRADTLRDLLLGDDLPRLQRWIDEAEAHDLTLLLYAVQTLQGAPGLPHAQSLLHTRLQALLHRDAEDLLAEIAPEVLEEAPVARVAALSNVDAFEHDSAELHSLYLRSDRAATLHATLSFNNDPIGASYYVGDTLQVELEATCLWADPGAWTITDYRVRGALIVSDEGDLD